MKRWMVSLLVGGCLAWGVAVWATPGGMDFSSHAVTLEMETLVMEVADDCTFMVAGERIIYLGSYTMDGISKRTEIVGEEGKSGVPLACRFRVGDRVSIHGALLQGNALFAFRIVRE